MLVLVLAGVTACAADASPDAAPSNGSLSFGVHVHAGWNDSTRERDVAIVNTLADAGVSWVRLDVGWASYEERCSGCISDWYRDRADAVIDAARARGMKVLAQVGMTPAWASRSGSTSAPPDDPERFGSFMGWLAEHVQGRVDAFELWNEPNSEDFWTGTAEQYVALVRSGYDNIKRVSPTVPVVLGGVSYNDTEWLTRLYDAGVAGSFDVLATHPYQAPADLPPEEPDPEGTNIWLITHVVAVRDLMVAHGDGGKQVWFTEFGWSTPDRPLGSGAPEDRGVTEEQQADYLVRTVKLIQSRYRFVTHVFWYNAVDNGDSTSQYDNFGLMDRDLRPKPALAAVRQLPASCSCLTPQGASR